MRIRIQKPPQKDAWLNVAHATDIVANHIFYDGRLIRIRATLAKRTGIVLAGVPLASCKPANKKAQFITPYISTIRPNPHENTEQPAAILRPSAYSFSCINNTKC